MSLFTGQDDIEVRFHMDSKQFKHILEILREGQHNKMAALKKKSVIISYFRFYFWHFDTLNLALLMGNKVING